MDQASGEDRDEVPSRRIDWPGALMALGVSLAVAGWAWHRIGPEGPDGPPAPGAHPPALRLLDPDDGGSLIRVGGPGKVSWIAFWSADEDSATADLRSLDRIWRRLKDRRRFSLVVAAIEADRPKQVLDAVAEAGTSLPVYLATPETRRAYGADGPPLHVLIGDDGRVLAVARGGGASTLDRMARLAEQHLDRIEPPPESVRFAWIPASFMPATSLQTRRAVAGLAAGDRDRRRRVAG